MIRDKEPGLYTPHQPVFGHELPMEGDVTLVRMIFQLRQFPQGLRPSEVHCQCSPQLGNKPFTPQGDLVSPMLLVSRALVKLSR